MVLKRLFPLLEPEFFDGGKRAVFLVNTVALVEQQAQVLERHLLLNGVGMYSGDMNLDFWNMATWREEFQKFQVMVMTAEILNQLLLKRYISLSNLALIILDECHHAVEDHPMRQIMRLFSDCPKEDQPRVIGLTATLLNGTPKSIPRVRDEVKKLEVTLHSTVATVNSWELVKQFSTKPRENFFRYKANINWDLMNFIDRKIEGVNLMCKKFSFVTENTCQIRYIDGFVPMQSAKKNDIANLMLQVSKQLGWLGPYGCFKTLQAIYVTLKLVQQKMADSNSHLMIHSLVCVLLLVSRRLESFMKDHILENEKALHYSSSKVQLLVRLLDTHHQKCISQPEDKREPMQALVFVEEKMTAKVLCSVLKNISRNSDRYGFIKTAFIVGGSSNPFNESWEGTFHRKINENIVQRFRQGELNVLVATDVLEEGIDIPACNLVVRFDLAKSFRSYVQSKGRARHSTSLFSLMVEESELSNYFNKIEYFKQIEGSLEELLVGHTDDRISPSELELEYLYESEVEPYYTSVGSKVTMTSSISLVNGYCMFLAHDRFSKVSPTWHRNKSDGRVIVAMQLPRLSPMQDIIKGQPMGTLKIAKRAAALEVCKRLHEVGELNDYLMPNEKCLEEKDMEELLPLWKKEDEAAVAGSTAKPGTKGRIRPYPYPVPLCFEDCSPKPQRKLYMHHIEMYPSYEDPVHTDPKKAVIYQVFKIRRNFALISSKPLNQVCQFPVFSKFGAVSVKVTGISPICLSEEQLMEITLFHWNLFTSLVPIAKSFVVFSRESYLVAATKHDAVGRVVLDWAAMKSCGSDYIGKDIPEKCVVIPTHRGSSLHEVYFVTRICGDLNGHSAFPNQMYKSYKDYYKIRHNVTLAKPELPLVEVQSFKTISNDLIPRMKSDSKTLASDTRIDTIYFPLELCQVFCIDGCLHLKASLLPSVLHRLDRLLVADELCRIIHTNIGNVCEPHDCSLARLTSLNPKSEDKSPVKPKVSFMKIENPAKKKRRVSAAPWGSQEEPMDLEHDFEAATAEEIEKYGTFFRKKVSADSFRARNEAGGYKRKLPTLQAGEDTIMLLKDRKYTLYPCHILEASTAASADDLVNLERLETLGDSFLKFAVSFMLYSRFPELSEGKLTQVKGQILGNRNLFYCAQAKQLGNFMKVKKLVPSEHWMPPSFSVPKEISDRSLGHMVRFLSLSKEERFNGVVKKESLNDLELASLKHLSMSGMALPSKTDGFELQYIPDKSVSDCVEALIGVCLQSAGPQAAMQFLEFMQVLPPKSKAVFQDFTQKSQYSRSFDHVAFNRTIGVVADLLGYKFKNSDLLLEALTHASSTSSTKTYERLEFVGDAVLDFLITAYIFENCGKLTPGELTDLRSALVNNITFACLSVRYNLHKLMNQGSIPLMEAIDRFVRFQDNRDHVIDEEILILLEEHECKIAETVDVPKALGDLFEALIGAVFIDSGGSFAVVWKVIYTLMKNEIRNFSQKVPKQVVRRLYEAVGEHHLRFRVSESTKDMAMEQVHGILEVQIGEEIRSFHGFGVNKTAAKKSAAKLALRELLIE